MKTNFAVLESYFSALEKNGIAYAVLHSADNIPHRITSDIDVVVQASKLEDAIRLQWNICASLGWSVVQILQHEICAYYSVLADIDHPNNFLKLDICSHYVWGGKVHIEADELLLGRDKNRGFFSTNPSTELLYLFIKAVAKGKSAPHFANLFQSLNDIQKGAFLNRIENIFSISQNQILEIINNDHFSFKVNWRYQPSGSRCFTIPERIAELKRISFRILYPTGLTLAIMGPDGVGKSTQISLITKYLEPFFRHVKSCHFRPKILDSKRNLSSAPNSNPHSQPSRGILISWFKVLFYYADHFLGYYCHIYPAMLHSTLWIYDRSFEDILIDPLRYRIKNSSILIRFLNSLRPRPTFTFILFASASVIISRKQELSSLELERQLNSYHQLSKSNHRTILIDANASSESVKQEILSSVISFLAKRTKQRWRRFSS